MNPVLGSFVFLSAPFAAAFNGDPGVVPPYAQNFVMLLVDDVGVDMVGAYEQFYDDHPRPGYPNTTPCIDYLARTGLTFRNAWTNPVCSPTRAQILTGKPSHRTGIGNAVESFGPVLVGRGLQLCHDTVPSVLRDTPWRPYHSAAVGKWHLADSQQFPPPSGGTIHMLGPAARPWFDSWAGTIANLDDGGGYNRWTKTFVVSVDETTDECLPAAGQWCQVPMSEYVTVDTADDAIYLVENLPEPFFLHVAFNAAHYPEAGPLAPLTAASCLGADGPVAGDTSCVFPGDIPHDTRAVVQLLDNEIGRIICATESGPRAPALPTTFLFMGDNGTRKQAIVDPFPREHSKKTVYEGGINVPRIVKSPLIPPERRGGHTEALVCSTDLLATLAEITGAPLPPDPWGQRDSISFLSVLMGGSESPRKHSYAEYFSPNFVPDRYGNPPPGYNALLHERAVCDEQGFKLIQKVTKGPWGAVSVVEELYDTALDPHELVNRRPDAASGVPRYLDRYLELSAELLARPLLVH